MRYWVDFMLKLSVFLFFNCTRERRICACMWVDMPFLTCKLCLFVEKTNVIKLMENLYCVTLRTSWHFEIYLGGRISSFYECVLWLSAINYLVWSWKTSWSWAWVNALPCNYVLDHIYDLTFVDRGIFDVEHIDSSRETEVAEKSKIPTSVIILSINPTEIWMIG